MKGHFTAMNLLALAIIFLSFSSALAVGGGGYENFLCPGLRTGKAMFNCTKDCIENHGAVDGKCGDPLKEDYNCYCEGATPLGGGKISSHCREPNDDYRNVCTVDCICNHAGFGGYCDWERNACFCQDQGKNIPNTQPACPAKDPIEFAFIVYNYLGPSGLTSEQLRVIGQAVMSKNAQMQKA